MCEYTTGEDPSMPSKKARHFSQNGSPFEGDIKEQVPSSSYLHSLAKSVAQRVVRYIRI
jgi:hypothetical protein